jgi:nucleoside-diphosphate-sugar epimerase
MRIFVAGGAGVIGRQLVPQLLHAGHDVVATTRDPRRAEWLRANGAEAVLLDVYDREAVLGAVSAARPKVVIHQLTDLASGFAPEQLSANARLRQVGTRHLVEAMLAARVSRLVAQSGAWLYGPGAEPHTEDHPLRDPAAAPDDPVLPGILELERLVLRTRGIDGIVLRYGLLYGPGTGRDGPTPRDAAWVHVADAARAAALAVEAPLGIYNIVDDGGSVSNARARRTLGWAPGSGVPTPHEQR